MGAIVNSHPPTPRPPDPAPIGATHRCPYCGTDPGPGPRAPLHELRGAGARLVGAAQAVVPRGARHETRNPGSVCDGAEPGGGR